jgi:hypothetical protein
MNQLIQMQKQQQVKQMKESLLEQKRKYNEFYLKKWQYYR